ncbi:hypothetical protein Cni_G26610 [Canna indica]|uniref:Lectin n=1 Tax=Canna indica TaxID=4628 RepID=A0AAQ3KZB9_9LILI|nr:hypothetical protein Cni_G26603 [Canna indica]WOL17817.1 hypothetical protein Cni_G26610 [Canna indica]
MNHLGHAETTHLSHWNGDHSDALVKADKDMIHISVKAMKITWGSDGRFWSWIQLPKDKLPKDLSKDEVGFDSAAELLQVSWLEVTGALDLANHKHQLSPSKTYEVIYHIKFKADAFGFSKVPITLLLVTPDGKREKISEMMETHRNRGVDLWHEIYGGEFRVPATVTGKVEFGVLEVESQRWKGGMIFAGVTIRPKMD